MNRAPAIHALSMIVAGLGRLARAAALWLAAGAAAYAAPSRTLNSEDVFHIYFVDVGAAASRAPDVANYIFERWRGLADGGRGQNGVLILIHGPRGPTKTLDLHADDAEQATAVSALLEGEVKNHDSQSPAGIELNEAAELIGEQVQWMLTRAVRDYQARNAVRGRFVVVHLIAEQLLFRSTEHGMATPLSRHDQPDRCFVGQMMSAAIADYPRRVKAALPNSPPVALRGALVLVAAGDSRFPPAAERAAALRLLGRAAVARQAVAMRDGLRCLEADSGIPIDAIDEAPCRPGGPGTAAPPPTRTAASCLDTGRQDIDTQRHIVQNARLSDLIAPIAQAADVLTADVLTADGLAAQSPRLTAPNPIPAPAPLPKAPAPSAQRPTPAPPSPATASQPQSTAPAAPAPRPRPTQSPSLPPSAAPGPGMGPPASQPMKPPTAATEPEFQLAQVSQAVSVQARPAAMPPGDRWINVDISVNEPQLRVLLVPAGLPPTAEVADGAVDITRGTLRRQPPGGAYALVARLAPGARCPGPAPLDFDVTVYGWAIPNTEAGRFAVRVLEACSPQGVVAVFGRVRLR